MSTLASSSNAGSTFRALLVREFAPYALLSSGQIDLLEAHYNLLVRWNARLNLTRIDTVEEAVRLHYCESLFVGTKLPAQPIRIVDVGSGAGFPGIPIAVLRPECTVTLVESHQRKAVFLREASRNLSNVTVVTDRAENLEAEFDWLVSRAVSFDDILKLKLTNNLALLVGGERVPGSGILEPIPWGAGRYLTFHVKHPC
jgi:16S rRNA (guanine(527)-N(7))-methyltransferase RsmG